MMQEEITLIQDRLQNILNSVKNQNSGMDVHTIGNLRNTAGLLVEQLTEDPECLESSLAWQIVKNLEDDLIEFYRKKYSYKL